MKTTDPTREQTDQVLVSKKITRRAALRASTAASACVLGSSVALARESLAAQQGAPAGEPSSFEHFCEEWLAIAGDYPERGLTAFPADEYLYRLGAAVTKLEFGNIPTRLTAGGSEDGLTAGLMWAQAEIFIIEQHLDPGTVFRAHNHPAFNSVTMVTKGDCKFRHFEPVGEAPDYKRDLRKTFQLQETRAGILKVGRMSSLSRSRENIHWFQAGDDGATLLDFSMGFGGSSGDFSMLEFNPDPVDAEQRIYEGFWIGNPYK
jgi:hypothetical protein